MDVEEETAEPLNPDSTKNGDADEEMEDAAKEQQNQVEDEDEAAAGVEDTETANDDDHNNTDELSSSLEPPPASISTASTGGIVASKRSGRGTKGSSTNASNEPILDAVTQASFLQASAILSQNGYPGVASLLSTVSTSTTSTSTASTSTGGTTSSTSNKGLLSGGGLLEGGGDATLHQLTSSIEATTTKLVTDSPPWIHWNRSDMAPQLKVDSKRLQVTGPLRGYRMARASRGVSSGVWYYECLILPGPSVHDILSQLPSQVRLGPGLEALLQQQLQDEKKEQQKASGGGDDDDCDRDPKRRKVNVGGHVRLGWSMRTGDLQAPVGYDKWSYGFRDIGGSLVHQSIRQDTWGGEGDFGPGDVIGCGIYLDESNPNHVPHIRFFVNGECRGNFVISKGKRVGGVAFPIEPGTYYPAVSLYMGGSVRVNFGPHWIYPPRKLPTGFPKFQPLSNLVPPPPSPSDAIAFCDKALTKVLRKPEHQAAVKNAVEMEARILCDAYDKYWKAQVDFVQSERAERGLTPLEIPTHPPLAARAASTAS